jgi:hypothetical protein
MNDAVKGLFAFTAGAVIGYFVARKVLETKYEQRYQEAVKDTKEAYSRLSGQSPADEEHTDNIVPVDELPDKKEYEALLHRESYILPEDIENKEKEEERTPVDRPYVISPEEFGELEGYETISLTYYADMQLADESDELVDDVDEIVGEDSLTQFGVYEDDSVFVRNDAKKCDYEILLDQRNYFDVIKTNPYRPVED